MTSWRDEWRQLPVLDPESMGNVHEIQSFGGSAAVQELLLLLDSEYQELRARFATAAARGDTAAVGLIAHTLRGSAANFGARRLATLCGAIEKAAKSGQEEPWSGWMQDIEDECTHALEAFRKTFPCDP